MKTPGLGCPRVAQHGQQAWWSLLARKGPVGVCVGGGGKVNQEVRVRGKEQASGCLDRLLVLCGMLCKALLGKSKGKASCPHKFIHPFFYSI